MAENHVLEIRHLSKSFGKHVVLRDIDFTVDTGGCNLYHRCIRIRQVYPAALRQHAGDSDHRRNSLS